MKIAHTTPEMTVFWYLDEKFVAQTRNFHESGVLPAPGKHKITVVDELGNEKALTITIE